MEAEPDRVFAPSGDSWNSFHERVERILEPARPRARGPHGRGRVPRRGDHGVDAAAARAPARCDERPAAADQHRPDRLGARRRRSTSGRCTPSTTPATCPASSPELDRARRSRVGTPAMGDGDEYTVASSAPGGRAGRARRLGGRLPGQPGERQRGAGRAAHRAETVVAGPVAAADRPAPPVGGPPDAPVIEVVDEDEWRPDVEDAAERIEDGWEPPPVIVSHQRRPARAGGRQPSGRRPAPSGDRPDVGGRRLRGPGGTGGLRGAGPGARRGHRPGRTRPVGPSPPPTASRGEGACRKRPNRADHGGSDLRRSRPGPTEPRSRGMTEHAVVIAGGGPTGMMLARRADAGGGRRRHRRARAPTRSSRARGPAACTPAPSRCSTSGASPTGSSTRAR